MKINSIISICLFCIMASSNSFSQKKDAIVRFISVTSDNNTVLETGPEFCVSKSDKCYIIDGNESKGYADMTFENIDVPTIPQSFVLIVNICDVEYAESSTGFSVFIGNQHLGSINQFNRNARAEVTLDPNQLKSKDSVTLTIKANGEDGLYIYSKKSGFGATLMITY